MSTATYEVAHILEGHQDYYIGTLNAYKKRILHAIRKCRTAALGGHIDKCNHDNCRYLHLSYKFVQKQTLSQMSGS